jgi:hypothetical protein
MTKQRAQFDTTVKKALGTSVDPSDLQRIQEQTVSAVTPEYEPYEDDDQPAWQAPDADDCDANVYDAYHIPSPATERGPNEAWDSQAMNKGRKQMTPAGLEPTTFGSGIRCSTN